MNYINKQSSWFGSHKQGSAANSEESQKIQLELVRLLYRHAPQAVGTSIIVASVLGGILWQVADHDWLLVWFSVLLLITILRAMLVIAFRRADITVINYERWNALYTAGALCAGLCWGSVAILWSSAWPVAYQVALVLTLAGLGAGAISTSTPRLATFAAFIFPLLLPLAGIMLLHKEAAYIALGLMMLIYPSMLFLITRNYHNTIRESLGYEFKNLNLLVELNEHVMQLEDEATARKEAQSDLITLNMKLQEHSIERERAKRLLSESEHQHRQIFESVTDAMLIFNNDGVIVKANPAAYVSYGYQNDELIGLTGRDIIHPDYHHRFELFQQQLKNEGEFHAESVNVRKDGSNFDTDVHGTRITFKGKTHLLAVVRDISKRKRTEAELTKYRQQLEELVWDRTGELEKTNEQLQLQIHERNQVEEQNRLLLESTLDGIYAVDHDGICTISNPAAAHMLGYDNPAELIGKNAHTLFHHSHSDGSAYPEQECILSHGYIKTINVDDETFWRADGTSFPVECHASPIYQDNEVVGSVVSFIDVSQRRETESQLRHAQKLEAVGQLAAGIAHEINTPAQFVNDNTRFLQEAFEDYDRLLKHYQRLLQMAEGGVINKEPIDKVKKVTKEINLEYLREEIPQAIEQSQEGLKRITKIVRAMKEFSHPGSREKIPTDINHAIETTIDVCRNEWKYYAEMETDLAPDLPQVPCLPDEINQVFLNLIVNASHAIADVVGNSGKMGVIRITTRQDDDWVEIAISDTGCGIPEKIQKRIFDPFFTTKEVGKGTGQGLAIVYSAVVDKHGGTIALDSKQGEGATFTIRLPIKTD